MGEYMGTHPIFESDFDCLTDLESRRIMAKRTNKVGIVGKYGTRYGASLRKGQKDGSLATQEVYFPIQRGQVAQAKSRRHLGMQTYGKQNRRRRLGTAHAKLPGRVDGHKANARRHCAVRKIGTPPDTKNKRETNAVSRLLSLTGTSSL